MTHMIGQKPEVERSSLKNTVLGRLARGWDGIRILSKEAAVRGRAVCSGWPVTAGALKAGAILQNWVLPYRELKKAWQFCETLFVWHPKFMCMLSGMNLA